MDMSMSREEAIAALRDVEDAEGRARRARAYRFGAPYLILWGIIWVVGYTLTGLIPARAGLMWLVLSAVGVAGGVALGRSQPRREAMAINGRDPRGKLWLVAWAAIWLFLIATYVVMRPTSSLQYEVYPAMVVSLVYVLAGVWGQPRYLWIGVGVFALSMLGFFFLKPVLPFWLAAVGGGGLILGGVWLRQP